MPIYTLRLPRNQATGYDHFVLSSCIWKLPIGRNIISTCFEVFVLRMGSSILEQRIYRNIAGGFFSRKPLIYSDRKENLLVTMKSKQKMQAPGAYKVLELEASWKSMLARLLILSRILSCMGGNTRISSTSV